MATKEIHTQPFIAAPKQNPISTKNLAQYWGYKSLLSTSWPGWPKLALIIISRIASSFA